MNQLHALPSYIQQVDPKEFQTLMIPEWIRLYLDYDILTKFLCISGALRHRKELLKNSNPGLYLQLSQDIDLNQKVEEDKVRFLEILSQELQKIESFILYKYQDLQQKLHLLTEQVKIMKCEEEQHCRKREILKQQFYELFKQQIQFKSYIQTHLIMMVQLQSEAKYCFRIDILTQDSVILEKLNVKMHVDMNKSHQLLSFNFYPYDSDTCKKNLEKYKNQRITNKPKNVYLLGLFVGISTVIISVLLLMRLEGFLDPEDERLFSPIFPAYRGSALFLIYYWLLTLDQYLWTKHDINYQLYLGFNYHFSTLTEVIKRVSCLSGIYLIFFLITCIEVEGFGFTKMYNFINLLPLIFWIIFLGYICIPTSKKFNGQGRAWMFRMFKGIIYTHFILYDGRYTFVLDQFISLISPIRDLEYTICYYSIDLFNPNQEIQHYKQCEEGQKFVSDICLIIIFGLKLLHCITLSKKNKKFFGTITMWSFLKSVLALSVGIVGCLKKFEKTDAIVWICLASTLTVIQYYWEVKIEWLLFEPGSKIRFLRNDLGFRKPWFYYFLMILNMIVISAWTFSISPQMYKYLKIPNQQLFAMLVGVMELTRRFIHNLLKVEREHIQNLRQFKASKDLQYPYKTRDEISIKFRLSNSYNQSIQEFQRLSLDIRRNTLLNTNMNDIEQLLMQPYDTQKMRNNAMINRDKYLKELQIKKYMKIIEQYKNL